MHSGYLPLLVPRSINSSLLKKVGATQKITHCRSKKEIVIRVNLYTQWVNSAGNKLLMYFSYKTDSDISYKLSPKDNLPEMSEPVLWEK